MAEAAREAGATIRLEAPVARIAVANGRAQGIVLQDGSELRASAVISNADPRRTLLTLVDPIELEPGVLQRLRNYRMPGTAAKVNLALGVLPPFIGIANPADLHGRIHVGPSIDYLEKAFDTSKYGAISDEPYLDITIPSLLDPDLCPPNRHVMSVVRPGTRPTSSRPAPTGRGRATNWPVASSGRWSATRRASRMRSNTARC